MRRRCIECFYCNFCPNFQKHPWMTKNGTIILPSESENCQLVEVSEEEIRDGVTSIPKLDTLILIKAMLKKHSFQVKSFFLLKYLFFKYNIFIVLYLNMLLLLCVHACFSRKFSILIISEMSYFIFHPGAVINY